MGKREWAAGQQSAVPSSTILSYYTIFRHDWQGFYNNVYPVKLQALYQKPANCTKKTPKRRRNLPAPPWCQKKRGVWMKKLGVTFSFRVPAPFLRTFTVYPANVKRKWTEFEEIWKIVWRYALSLYRNKSSTKFAFYRLICFQKNCLAARKLLLVGKNWCIFALVGVWMV